jgi:hypothetical protein
MTAAKVLGLLSIGTLLCMGRVASAGECHDQPNMAMALHSLEKARADLERAEHNKGGWRETALRHVDEALKETHRGCEVANEERHEHHR